MVERTAQLAGLLETESAPEALLISHLGSQRARRSLQPAKPRFVPGRIVMTPIEAERNTEPAALNTQGC